MGNNISNDDVISFELLFPLDYCFCKSTYNFLYSYYLNNIEYIYKCKYYSLSKVTIRFQEMKHHKRVSRV